MSITQTSPAGPIARSVCICRPPPTSYGVDRDFGPFFVKLGTYFPSTGKLCLNGHEYVKRQLTRAGIAFEALDKACSLAPIRVALR